MTHLHPATGPRPMVDLVEEVVDKLTSEQLLAIAYRKRAIEQQGTQADEERRLAERADPATTALFEGKRSLSAQLRQIAEVYRSVGIDDDIIGAKVLASCDEAGIDLAEAMEAIEGAGIAWHPRSQHDRLAEAAGDLWELGIPTKVVAHTLVDAAVGEGMPVKEAVEAVAQGIRARIRRESRDCAA